MGIELRIRDPRVEGVAPLRCAALSVGEDDEACRAGVSRTNFRNCELFIMALLQVVGGGMSLEQLCPSALCLQIQGWSRGT